MEVEPEPPRLPHFAEGDYLDDKEFKKLLPQLGVNVGLSPGDFVAEREIDTMVGLAKDGMTMLVVSHEMGFAREVANRMIFMDEGQIVEINEPRAFFEQPQHERTKLFLSQILH